MYAQRLVLTVSADKEGWKVVSPAALTGESGIVHNFGFLVKKGPITAAFDIYEEVTEVDIIRSYIKKFDTGIRVAVICSGAKTSESAGRLAEEYGIPILDPTDAGSFLSSGVMLLEGQETRSKTQSPQSRLDE